MMAVQNAKPEPTRTTLIRRQCDAPALAISNFRKLSRLISSCVGVRLKAVQNHSRSVAESAASKSSTAQAVFGQPFACMVASGQRHTAQTPSPRHARLSHVSIAIVSTVRARIESSSEATINRAVTAELPDGLPWLTVTVRDAGQAAPCNSSVAGTISTDGGGQ